MTRADLLIDLADAVRQMTAPHTHTEKFDVNVVKPDETTGRRRKARRSKQRRAHTITVGPLLDELRKAASPGSNSDTAGAAAGGFESRPSAELGPLSLLREIDGAVAMYARALHVDRSTLPATMSRLVGATMDDETLADLTRDAQSWVRRARIVIGLDLAPVTVAAPCPYCKRANSLVITGDMETAKCGRCGTEWSHDVIGLLADMLRANETQETMPLTRCMWWDCTRRGPHEQHQNQRGQTWVSEARCLDEDRSSA